MSNKKNKRGKWSRRAFIATGGLVGVGLVVGVGGNILLNNTVDDFTGKGFGEGNSLNAWIRIAPDNTITLAVPRAEMGQGVHTSVPMLIAEELEVDMADIKIVQPQAEPAYANTLLLNTSVLKASPRRAGQDLSFGDKVAHFLPLIATGGSTTIPDGFDHMRVAGASAREMLIEAAAEKWGVDKSDCYAENAHVINKKSNEKLTYGSLAEAASNVKLASVPKLKDKKDCKIIGKPIARIDIPEKVTGEAEFLSLIHI